MKRFSPFNRALTTIVRVIVVVAVQASIANAQTVKYTPPKVTPANGEQLTIAEALDGRVTIDFDEVDIDDAVDALKAAIGIEIQISVDALEETGIGADEAITFRLANITLRSALKHLLRQIHPELTYMIQNEVLMIVSDYESYERLITKFYNVDDLLPPLGSAHEGPPPWIGHVHYYGELPAITPDSNADYVDVDYLIEAIMYLDASSWGERGGPGSIVDFEGMLVIKHTVHAHHRVENLLRIMRKLCEAEKAGTAIPYEPILIGSVESQNARAAIDAALAKPCSFDVAEAPLDKVVGVLQDRLGIPMLLDRRALHEIEIGPDTPATFHAENSTAKEALERMLAQLDPTLTYEIDDEVLVITTSEAAEMGYGFDSPLIYPVADLVRPDPDTGFVDLDFNSLIEAITFLATPDIWDESGHQIAESEFPSVLFITQTRKGHEQIADALTVLRQAIADRKAKYPARPESVEPAQNPKDEYELIVYHLQLDPPRGGSQTEPQPRSPSEKQKLADDAIALIKELIEPKSWSSDKAVIRCVNERLVVRHQPHVQMKVQDLLTALGLLQPAFF